MFTNVGGQSMMSATLTSSLEFTASLPSQIVTELPALMQLQVLNSATQTAQWVATVRWWHGAKSQMFNGILLLIKHRVTFFLQHQQPVGVQRVYSFMSGHICLVSLTTGTLTEFTRSPHGGSHWKKNKPWSSSGTTLQSKVLEVQTRPLSGWSDAKTHPEMLKFQEKRVISLRYVDVSLLDKRKTAAKFSLVLQSVTIERVGGGDGCLPWSKRIWYCNIIWPVGI